MSALKPPHLPLGTCRYEIRRGGELIALETASLEADRLSAARRSLDGASVHEVEAALGPGLSVTRVAVRYRRGPFERDAVYQAADEDLRGSVSALAGRTAIVARLGRFREIDADFILFKALIIAHVCARGQLRWTGRVAVIDSATLVASSVKQTYRVRDETERMWLFEPRMGESEELEIDAEGRLLRRADSRGLSAALVDA